MNPEKNSSIVENKICQLQDLYICMTFNKLEKCATIISKLIFYIRIRDYTLLNYYLKNLLSSFLILFFPSIYSRKEVKKRKLRDVKNVSLNLKPGELVEVLSWNEIRSSLDKKGKYNGFLFMPEQRKFCGNRYEVLKRVERIEIEGKGLKRINNTVFLKDVYCDGSVHQGCQRTCYCFWRERWLKRL